MCSIQRVKDNKILFVVNGNENIYTSTFYGLNKNNVQYFSAIERKSWVWHRRLEHANRKLINKLSNHDLVVELTQLLNFKKVRYAMHVKWLSQPKFFYPSSLNI